MSISISENTRQEARLAIAEMLKTDMSSKKIGGDIIIRSEVEFMKAVHNDVVLCLAKMIVERKAFYVTKDIRD